MIETSQTKSDTTLLSPWTLLSISLFIVIVALLTVNNILTYWWMVESGVNRVILEMFASSYQLHVTLYLYK